MAARSPESIARRHAYTAAWRAARPEYGRNWATAHLDAERARRRRWKLANPATIREQRRRARLRRSGSSEPLPTLHLGHPLFDQARAIVGPDRSVLTIWLDPLYDDLISVATLAILRGEDAAAAVHQFRSAEMTWRGMTCEIPAWSEEIAA